MKEFIIGMLIGAAIVGILVYFYTIWGLYDLWSEAEQEEKDEN